MKPDKMDVPFCPGCGASFPEEDPAFLPEDEELEAQGIFACPHCSYEAECGLPTLGQLLEDDGWLGDGWADVDLAVVARLVWGRAGRNALALAAAMGMSTGEIEALEDDELQILAKKAGMAAAMVLR